MTYHNEDIAACMNDRCPKRLTCLRWQLGTNKDTYQTYLDGSVCGEEFYVEITTQKEEVIMTTNKLFKAACERCEGYSISTKCEVQDNCPVYKLYLLASQNHKTKYDDWRGAQGNCDFEPQPRPEMI